MRDDAKNENPRILIIANDRTAVEATSSFLVRRDHAVSVVTTLNDALPLITKNSADIILLSINIPHPKIEIIPALLNQTFGVEVIVFAESSDRRSTSKLKACKAKHILSGLVSGPAVQMRIRQIRREAKDNHDQDTPDRIRTEKGPDQSEIHVASSLSNNDQGSIVLKGVKQPSANAISTLLKTLLPNKKTEADDKRHESLASPQGEGTKNESLATAANPSCDQHPEHARGTLANGLGAIQQTYDPVSESGGSNFDEATINKHDGKGREKPIEANTKLALVRSERPEEKNQSTEQSAPQKPYDNQNENGPIPGSASSPASAQHVMTLWKCADAAVRDVCGEDVRPLNYMFRTRRCGIFMVKSQLVKGCFIFCLGESDRDGSIVFPEVTERLLSYLNNHGMRVEYDDTRLVETTPDYLSEESLEYAEFLSISSSSSVELATAFIFQNELVPILQSEQNQMMKVEVQSIPPEINLPFNAFLYLPYNRKYIRYLKSGKYLTRDQHNRLIGANVQHLHVPESDASAYAEFQTKKAINLALEIRKRNKR